MKKKTSTMAMLLLGSVFFASNAFAEDSYYLSENTTGTNTNFTITKYEVDTNGDLKEVDYDLKFNNPLGNGDGDLTYFKWSIDADTKERTLVAGDADNYDISVYANSTDVVMNESETDSVSTNYSTTTTASGGAISNENSADYGDIAKDFISNFASAYSNSAYSDAYAYAYGGAIYNYYAEIGDITGDFIGNYAKSSATATSYYTSNEGYYGKSQTYGGAIYNYYAEIGSISGNFIGNYASAYSSNTSNASSSYSYVMGGAIYNESASIDDIIGDFINNYASFSTYNNYNTSFWAYGGAIANYGSSSVASTIGNITGDFIANYIYVYSDSDYSMSAARGGAIYNYYASIEDITGDFIDNYVYVYSTDSAGTYATSSLGGAISNYGASSNASASTIGDITGDFIGNYVYASSTLSSVTAKGGAICNMYATIDNITGNFIANYAITSSSYSSSTSYSVYGGAICNYGYSVSVKSKIGNITGDFIANYVSAVNPVYGGAISNYYATIGDITGDFTGNYAISTSGSAYGGAIYNGRSTIDSITGNITGNYVNASSTAQGGAIYNVGYSNSGGTIIASASITLSSDAGNDYYYIDNFATTKTLAYEDDGVTLKVDDDGHLLDSEGNALLDSDDDKNGGFLYMDISYSYATTTTNFDTAANSSITIGDGTAGYDSIASGASSSISINKTGEGDLIVNSSMRYYCGNLNVLEGYMYVASDISSTSIIDQVSTALTVSSGATFEIDGTAYFNSATIAGAVIGDITASSLTVSGTITGDVSVSDSVSLIISSSNAGSNIIDGTLSGDYTTANLYISDIGAALSSLGSTIATTSSDVTWTLDSDWTSDFEISLDGSDSNTYILSLSSSSSASTVDGNIYFDLTENADAFSESSEAANTIVNATLDSTGTTSDVTLSTNVDYTLSTDMTVDKVETTDNSTLTVGDSSGDSGTTSLTTDSTNDSNITVVENGSMTTGSITSESNVVVDGGSLYYDNSLADESEAEVATNLVLQNSDGSLDESHEDDYDADVTTVTNGYVGIVHSDGNIILTEESETTSSTYLLDGETTLEAGEDGAVVVTGNVAVNKSKNNTDTDNNTVLNITGDLSLAEGTNLDSTGVDLTITEDNSTISSSNASITVADGETALTVSGEGVTVAGTLTSTTGDDDTSSTAITVSNSSGEINFADGAVIASDGIALTNDHDATGTNGVTLISGEQTKFYGSVEINSPLTIISDGASENGSTVTVAGGIITTNASGSDSSDITIGENTNLVLTTDSTYIMASFVDAGAIILEGDDSNVATVAVESAVTMLVGDSYQIADSLTVEAQGDDDDSFDFTTDVSEIGGDFDFAIDEDDGAVYATVLELTNFQDAASSANEDEIAIVLDALEASEDEDENIDLRDFKSSIYEAGLSSVLMNNYSYIAEVDTMLLSNQNFANVNRARSILEKSTSYEEVESEVVSAIKYSKVAQLQSINLLGSKSASNGVAGYDYWSVGSTANIDFIASEYAMGGISIGGTYNKAEGDLGDNANSTAFLLNAYGVIKSGKLPFELFANIGYAHFWNEGSKSGAFADWDSDAFNALAGIAFDIDTGVAGLAIKPLAMLNFVALNSNSATYSNGVEIDEQNYISAKAMLGLEVEYAITEQFSVLARAMYAYELGDESYNYSYSVGGILNNLSYVGGEAGKNSAVLGLGLSYDFSETCSLYFDYNAYIYENLTTHSLNLSLGLKF